MTEKALRNRMEQRRIVLSNRRRMKEYDRRLMRRNYALSEFTTVMKDKRNILEIEDLTVEFLSEEGSFRALEGVSFSVPQGSMVGLVGDSDAGKSVVARSVFHLLNRPSGRICKGAIRLRLLARDQTVNIAEMPLRAIAELSGKEASMLYGDAFRHLQPLLTVGEWLAGVMGFSEGSEEEAAKERIEDCLAAVNIAEPQALAKMYPRQLSDGMQQRIMTAAALAGNPSLLIADEPAAGLDVTLRAQHFDLLYELKTGVAGAILLIGRDLSIVREMCDRVVVMHKGRVVERGMTEEVFTSPAHPYTVSLLQTPSRTGRNVDRLFRLPNRGRPVEKDEPLALSYETLSDTHAVLKEEEA